MMRSFAVVACVAGLAALAPGARAQLSASDLATLQEAYVKASNTDPQDLFGSAVAVSGNTAVVGATAEESSSPGVNGNQNNNNLAGVGAAYVFVRSGAGVWTQQAYLKASNPGAGDNFGSAVAISGDTIVVGAAFESSSGQGIDPDGSDNAKTWAGAAYVFVRSGTTWSQQAFLKASNSGFLDRFGTAVAVSGDTLVVGAPNESSAATGVNGNQGDGLNGSGAAYVFVRHGLAWSQQAYLKASNTGFNDVFGLALAISGDTIVVGAKGEDSAASGIDGGQGDNDAVDAGAAYVFTRSGSTWSQQAYVKASNTGSNDAFGSALSISGDTLAIAAPFEASGATGVDGNQADDSAVASGAVYVFQRSGTTWSQQAYVKASNTELGDTFGTAVGVSGDVLAVGAEWEASRATGINGLQTNESAPAAGAAYVFEREAGVWAQQVYVKASNTTEDDRFGRTLGVDGDVLIVGAYLEDSTTSGINGPDNNQTIDSGAAYTYDLGSDTWTELGFGLAGAAGVPSLLGTGPLNSGSAGTLNLTSAAPSALSLLFISLASTPTPFKCGTLATVPIAMQLPLATNGSGAINLAWASWPGGLSGLNLYFQYAVQDGTAVCGVALSNALRASIP